ncbi:MAG: hypothetical protein IKO55_08190 [Kiritimatiellae bacterium]|nr:hypothetical protein [Kiritimatiellia bacterium]
MGFSVGKLDDLMAKLKQSDRDWCLVVLLDHENMSPAARQMDQLLDDLDEDSGEAFDFYLPGYDTPTPRQCSVETQHPRRNWRGPFDRWRFRDIYKAIGFESFGQWRFLGDCEVLLFQTKTPRGDGRCYGGDGDFRQLQSR